MFGVLSSKCEPKKENWTSCHRVLSSSLNNFGASSTVEGEHISIGRIAYQLCRVKVLTFAAATLTSKFRACCHTDPMIMRFVSYESS